MSVLFESSHREENNTCLWEIIRTKRLQVWTCYYDDLEVYRANILRQYLFLRLADKWSPESVITRKIDSV